MGTVGSDVRTVRELDGKRVRVVEFGRARWGPGRVSVEELDNEMVRLRLPAGAVCVHGDRLARRGRGDSCWTLVL